MANDIKKEQVKNEVKQIVNAAKAELNDEMTKKFTEAIKVKLVMLATAQEVVKNVKREIEDIEIKIAEKLA